MSTAGCVVQVDMHGKCMSYVVGGCNVVAIK